MGNCITSSDAAVSANEKGPIIEPLVETEDSFISSASVIATPTKPVSQTEGSHFSYDTNSSSSLAVTPVEHSLRKLMTRDVKQRDLLDFYEKLEVLGVGSMGSVTKVQKKTTGAEGFARRRRKVEAAKPYPVQYALKTILLDRVSDPVFIAELRNEIEVLKSCDHPNIVKAIETFDYNSQISIIMELCSGGDLYMREPYTEEQARRIIRNLTSAIAYMHRCGIVHRDIKYENIMFESNHPNAEIKIVDFGISRKYRSGKSHLHDCSGTIYAIAPEVLKKDYTSQADLWSIGVIAFMTLTSTKPFDGASTKEVILAILNCNYSFTNPRWEANSVQSKAFVKALLEKDPTKRLTGQQALHHPWLEAEFSKSTFDVLNACYSMEQIKASLLQYARYSKLKKLALMIVAHKSSSEEIGERLRNTFQKFDILRNGTVCFEEFLEVMSRSFPDMSEQCIKELFIDIDLDGSGLIHYTEFVAATIELCGPISEERLEDVFDQIDRDDTCCITKDDLKEFMNQGFLRRDFSDDYVAEVIEESDLNGDGVISFDEFLALFPSRTNFSDRSSLVLKPVDHTLRKLMTRDIKQRNVLDFYEKVDIIGIGSMGAVIKVKKRANAVGGSARKLGKKQPSTYEIQYALKTIVFDKMSDPTFIEELRNEIEVLKSCDHPNIVKAIETFEYNSQISIVMELCSGGDLYTREPYTEEQARRIIRNLTSAIAYMHRCGLVHRDLKYENIMFESSHPNAEIKVIDFGLSQKYSLGNPELSDRSGTIYSIAPEVLNKAYTSQADLWSVGVIAFMILTSSKPFDGASMKDVIRAILSCNYSFSSSRWDVNSLQSKAFVKALLVKDPTKRLTGQQALRHPWLEADFSKDEPSTIHECFSLEQIKASLLRYASYNKLKKLALMIVAHKSTAMEIGDKLRNTFHKLDVLRNGTICFEEFHYVLSRAFTEMSNKDIAQLFTDIDLDGSGLVHYTEFVAATIELSGPIAEERLAEAFDRIDSDDTGFITRENVKEFTNQGFLWRDFSDEFVSEMIKEVDLNGDGVVSYDEFLTLFHTGG